MNAQQVMDEVASRWTQLDEEAKEPYRVKAQMDKARYDRQLQEYKSRQHMSPQAEKENQAAAPEPQPEPCLKLTHQSSQSSCLTEPFTPVQESLEEKFFAYKDPALDEHEKKSKTKQAVVLKTSPTGQRVATLNLNGKCLHPQTTRNCLNKNVNDDDSSAHHHSEPPSDLLSLGSQLQANSSSSLPPDFTLPKRALTAYAIFVKQVSSFTPSEERNCSRARTTSRVRKS